MTAVFAAPDLRSNLKRLWNTGSPAFAGDDVRWVWRGWRQIRRLKVKTVTQILALLQNALQEGAVGVARHHRLDQIELVHGDELQDFGAGFSGRIARQGLHHLDMLRRFWAFGRREFASQLRLQRALVGLHKSIESDA